MERQFMARIKHSILFINDILVIYDHANVRNIKTFRIFDRWGALVFEQLGFPPNDEAYGWDGKKLNKPLPSGIYVYYAEIEFTDGETLIKKGDITLIK